jgi:hypothetical protein
MSAAKQSEMTLRDLALDYPEATPLTQLSNQCRSQI